MTSTRPLKVFLCHASADKPAVHKLYRYLRSKGMEPWLDAENLLPGENWELEIPKALFNSDVILVCLSKNSVNKEGYIQKEITFALDKALEKPEGMIFVIPAKLEECNIPQRLNRFQWVDLYREDGRKRLMLSLNKRAAQLGPAIAQAVVSDETTEKVGRVAAEKAAREKAEHEAIEKAERDAQEKAEHDAAEKAAREKAEREAFEKAEREKRAQERAEATRRAREATAQSLRGFLPKLKIPALILFLSFIGYLLWQGADALIPDMPPPTPVTSTQTPSATRTLFVELGTETPVPVTSTATVAPMPTLGIGSTWLRPADGMEMVYVPEGEFTMGSDDGADDEKPAHQVYLDAYWIDRTEVTNAMYAKCVADGSCKNAASSVRSSKYANHPVIYVNWDDAQEYCTWAEVRLPTEAEWEKAARGTDGRIYPWGNDNDPAKYYVDWTTKPGTINVGLDTKPVGSYPSGASPYSALDMAGSAWEWVSDWYSPTYYQTSSLSNPQGPDSGDNRWPRGGSWGNVRSSARSDHARYELHLIIPTISELNIGFRCARSLPSFSPAITPVLVTSTPTIIPMSTLGIGSTMIGEDGAVLVYVPAGKFTMGSDDGDADEKPVHTVRLDAFWIDQTEVTNKQYAACVAAGRCDAPSQTNSYKRASYYGNSEFDEFPVVYVNWEKAKTYCEWAGKRLPTEAQWEKAARGTDARIYPWGNDALNKDFLNYSLNLGDTTKVGSYDVGKSFYGAYDMAGNVLEWVNDWYGDTYYQSSSSSKNPLGPNTGLYRVLRGGAWNHSYSYVCSTHRDSYDPAYSSYFVGFRCTRGKSP
jgi:formylglycine-generating enzyme required for sulfatase activity